MGNLTHGMSIAEVEALARTFTTEMQSLRDLASAVDARCRQAGWKGGDAEEFGSDWGAHKARIDTIVTSFERCVETLTRNIDEQRRTSDEVGGTGGALPTYSPASPSDLDRIRSRRERLEAEGVKPVSLFDIGDGSVSDNVETMIKVITGPIATGYALSEIFEKWRRGEYTAEDSDDLVAELAFSLPWIGPIPGAIRDSILVNFPQDIAEPLLVVLGLDPSSFTPLDPFGFVAKARAMEELRQAMARYH